MNNIMTYKNYIKPTITVVGFLVESGFAGTGNNPTSETTELLIAPVNNESSSSDTRQYGEHTWSW